jgi:hypothetical protein
MKIQKILFSASEEYVDFWEPVSKIFYEKLGIESVLIYFGDDDYVLTSKHNIFCKPGMKINNRSIIVMPELTPIYSSDSFNNCYGVLTDYPINIKEKNYKLFVT